MGFCRLSTGEAGPRLFRGCGYVVFHGDGHRDESRCGTHECVRRGSFLNLRFSLETGWPPRCMPEMQYFHALPGVVNTIVNDDGTMH